MKRKMNIRPSVLAAMFLAGAVTNAIPGIILQIVLVPILVMVLNRVKDSTYKI